MLPFLLTLAVVVVGLGLANWGLKRRWKDDPDAQFRFQLIMLALTFAGLLAVIVALPINDALRGQLLGLIGILLSAAIALSSTTFIGNIMAGIMLKVVRNARPGDFITVADLTGRITEMDLLHTEIQTEFRDLVTVPNLYMVTQPLQVVRKSGTIITAEVSLGYDVAHQQVSRILRQATEQAGLGEGFVQVRELGDFSVTYRVAGLLEDVKSLISARSRLRECMLDALHEANIEIVSPNFMNTRALDTNMAIIPEKSHEAPGEEEKQGEDIAFDKAEEAASIEEVRQSIETIAKQIEALAAEPPDDAEAMRSKLEKKQAALLEQLRVAEEAIKASETADGHKGS
ncbi:MAG: mechanosensitive ion channel [Xanthomonadales bacterium]|nr:mechanosensitive ion channel [Gammaproteobacteria bacterium]NNE06307.1 mechanosensitive ion channel [Xanthomonadales bacterium]NNL94746.1 mechanosensitive ion channel [Xanthomonadales bacterium]